MNRMILLSIMLMCSVPVFAESLVPHAIICDNREDLDVLEMENLRGKDGAEIFKRVKSSIDFNEQYLKMANRMKGVALSGSMPSLKSDITHAEDENKRLKKFSENCMETAELEEPASIVEAKAIAGVVKVRAMVKGISAETWTKNEFVKK